MGRASQPINNNIRPNYPKRKWYQYLPFFNKGYEDELGKYQNQYNEWNWNKENLYNSPASQMDRWKEAGLSTNLMYGQGTPGNASQPANAEISKSTDSIGVSSGIDRLMEGKMKLAQIKDVEAAAKLKEYQTQDLKAEIFSKDTPHNWNVTERDIKDMSSRQRTAYTQSMQEYHKLIGELYKAGSEKNKEMITHKIAALQDKMMIMQMISGGMSAIGRFIP